MDLRRDTREMIRRKYLKRDIALTTEEEIFKKLIRMTPVRLVVRINV